MTTREMFQHGWMNSKFVCVGLDTDPEKTPEFLRISGITDAAFYEFNRRIVMATIEDVLCYKLNYWFYAKWLNAGMTALWKTIKLIKETDRRVPIILDFKVSDIGNTAKQASDMAFKELEVDAVTVNPYLGQEALAPFLGWEEKMMFVLCKTSNPGSHEFQNLKPENDHPLYIQVAKNVAEQWNGNNNCGLVTGATFPTEIKLVRDAVGDDIPLLIPGIGKQAGDLEATIKAGVNESHRGIIINSSRGIIYASDEDDFDGAALAEVEKLTSKICDIVYGD